MSRIVILFFVIIVALGCSGKRNPEYMQQATGKPGDIIIIIDSMQWNDTLGTTIKNIFKAEVEGLPREELIFDVINVHPSQKITLLKQIRNLVYVFTLDQKTEGAQSIIRGFTPETINQIRSDSSYYIYTEDDVNARGQKVMYLFGATEESLIRHLEKNKHLIVDYFNRAERERLEKNLFRTRTTEEASDFLRKEQKCDLRIPYGYRLADKQKDFIWFRKVEMEIDKNVFIAWKPYTSEYQLLPDSLISWRNEVAKQYLYEDPENPASYIVTETEVPFIPVRPRQVELKGHYAMELRGLWRTNNKSMGGPFVGYGLIDQGEGLLYYIEGFAYSPGKAQRETMRELETILWTFKTSDDLAENAKK